MALLCGRAFYLLECFLRQAVMLFLWFIASASPRRSECVCFHMCTKLWHYQQKYTVVSVTRRPLFESDVTYEQPTQTLLVVLCGDWNAAVHLSFSSKSTTPQADPPSPAGLTSFLRQDAMSEVLGLLQHAHLKTNPGMIRWCSTLFSSCGASGQAEMWQHLFILPRSGVAGPFCRSWQMDQAALRQREEMRSGPSHRSTYTVWLTNLVKHVTWKGRFAALTKNGSHDDGTLTHCALPMRNTQFEINDKNIKKWWEKLLETHHRTFFNDRQNQRQNIMIYNTEGVTEAVYLLI